MKEKSFSIRKLFGKIHLWLGLLSGIILFFVCLSGTIFTFRFDIDKILYPSQFYINFADNTKCLPIDSIASTLEKKYNAKLADITIPVDKKSVWDVTLQFTKIDSSTSIKVNPYTATIVESKRTKGDDFFSFIYNLHTTLLFNNSAGEAIVGVSTIIFIVML